MGSIRSPFANPLKSPFTSPFSVGGMTSRPLPFDKVLAWHLGRVNGPNATLIKDYATNLGDFYLIMTGSSCITLDGATAKGTTGIDHGDIEIYEGTCPDLAYDGTDLTGSAGTFYNLWFTDGTFFPCIGKTTTLNPTTIYSTDGSTMVLTGTPAALHAGSQDTLFYGAHKGYWEDGSGRYPYPHSGATFHAGNKFNDSMNSFELAYNTTMKAQDDLEGPFWFSGTTPVPKTQTEIEIFVVGKAASFFCVKRGLKLYNEILTGAELTAAQGDCP